MSRLVQGRPLAMVWTAVLGLGLVSCDQATAPTVASAAGSTAAPAPESAHSRITIRDESGKVVLFKEITVPFNSGEAVIWPDAIMRDGDIRLRQTALTPGPDARPMDSPVAASDTIARTPVSSVVVTPSVQQRFDVVEATIADIQDAMKAKRLTCRALVDEYLKRIDAYDRRGPAINAIVVVNPKARDVADSLDKRYAASGPTGPLHCIPIIVKDNMETTDLATTAGSRSLAGFMSPKDAFIVQRIRAAGAIVLAKSNMAEFAFSPVETLNSILGYTFNPYALNRVPAGSSGGTAASIAASFGAVGLGTDTGNSIRGPSAHNDLVGIRSTMGLVSRGGIVPLSLAADVAGPMARTVADAAAVLQVLAGEDPADSATIASRGHAPPDYSKSLVRDGLRGARIGVLRMAYETLTTDSEVVAVFMNAIEELKKAGAIIVDPIVTDSLNAARRGGGNCNQFKYDIDTYLKGLGAAVPVHSLDEIIASKRYHASVEARLMSAQAVTQTPAESPGCRTRDVNRERLRTAVLSAMDSLKLDALVYPTWSNPPRVIGDLSSPAGDNSQLFSPSTGFPAITVPMGFTRGNTLPAGMQFFGRPWAEATLFKLAYSYEQATKHRRPPTTTPVVK